MQSGYHNLPTINGLDQMAGEKYRATYVNCDLSVDHSSISMHLEDAYPLRENSMDHIDYVRTLLLDRAAEAVTLTDITDHEDVILNFITYEELRPSDDPDTFLLGNALIRFSGASVISTETLPITDPRLKLSWDHDLYRIRLRKEARIFKMTVKPNDQ